MRNSRECKHKVHINFYCIKCVEEEKAKTGKVLKKTYNNPLTGMIREINR